ncbi:hypothetical protein [uncultured Methanospirillum sp.]|uniref:hypothetical protein n=1 Tax=uncultured Methanospirillum sp. TaxID=262503 RepID=UPI0029C6B820|nr:hypothetical protein [uncultured Methanospirillum sp.]
MKKECIIAGAICLILAGLAGAEYLSTAISTDGCVMLTTAGSDDNGSFASRAIALDAADLHRTVSGEVNTQSDLVVRSQGPLLFSDYASALWKSPDLKSMCSLILTPDNQEHQEASTFSSGIVRQGEYITSRAIREGLFGETSLNGTGLLLFGSQGKGEGEGNRSVSGHGFVSGNMSVRDLVRYGGRV